MNNGLLCITRVGFTAQQARDCRAVAMVTWFSNRDLWQQLKYTLRLTCFVLRLKSLLLKPLYKLPI